MGGVNFREKHLHIQHAHMKLESILALSWDELLRLKRYRKESNYVYVEC